MNCLKSTVIIPSPTAHKYLYVTESFYEARFVGATMKWEPESAVHSAAQTRTPAGVQCWKNAVNSMEMVTLQCLVSLQERSSDSIGIASFL